MYRWKDTAEHIAADRMWRDVDARKAFERDTGKTDEQSGEYQEEFIEWAAHKLRCPYEHLSGPGKGCRYPKCGPECLGRYHANYDHFASATH